MASAAERGADDDGSLVVARDAPAVRTPRWSAVVLVCKACGKRGSGPKKLKPKALASALRKEMRREGDRSTRVVMTSCLGLCPKNATTVVQVGRETSTRMVAVRSKKEIGPVLASLRAASS